MTSLPPQRTQRQLPEDLYDPPWPQCQSPRMSAEPERGVKDTTVTGCHCKNWNCFQQDSYCLVKEVRSPLSKSASGEGPPKAHMTSSNVWNASSDETPRHQPRRERTPWLNCFSHGHSVFGRISNELAKAPTNPLSNDGGQPTSEPLHYGIPNNPLGKIDQLCWGHEYSLTCGR